MSLEQLGDVEVTSVSKQPEEVWRTPAAIYVLTQDDIQQSGATTIPELLRMIPGVQVSRSQSDQWAVAIRGFDGQFSQKILVLIDGRSVYTPLFEGVYWDVQDLVLEDIDRIEVVRGPGGTIWGPNAVNGVINIITKHARDTQGTLLNGAGGSPVDRFVGEVQQGLSPTKQFQFRIFAKGFDRGPELNPGNDPYDQWHQARGGFRGDWEPNVRDSLTASAAIYQGKTGAQTAIGEFFPPRQLITDAPQSVSGGDLVLRWARQLSGQSNFYLQAYFDRTNRQTPQFGETRNTFDLDFIDHVASLPRQDLIFGAGLRESPSNIIQNQATVNFSPHQMTDYIYSWFLQDTFMLVRDHLSLTLGSKFEDNNYSGLGVEPSARLLWNPAAHQAFWASVSRALRTPGRLDRDLTLIGNDTSSPPPIFVAVEGDPNFKPEVLIGWEAGYRQLLTRRLYVDLATFHNQYDDLEGYGNASITVPTEPYPYILISVPYGNTIKGVTDGLELAPSWIPARWLTLRGSFSHLHMGLYSKPGYNDASYVATYEGSSPHSQANAQSIFNLPHRLQIALDYRFMSALPAQNAPAYQTGDARVAWRFARHFGVSAVGQNLLQPSHMEFLGDNSNPVGIRRSILGDLTWTR